ncbi:flagellar export chaperone FliS [Pseudoduganella sp. FT25W]|jgi:flagellar protein FliS|uniref:Flagellar secretion chaperone FliS n=1 Tax=Duganella alba TaxID=2666081 RepID=A0A6L5QES6_9BURK|nr:flagellar export chaperone FliS [Duganella alba]MRX08169.1 flagellar export chaperone FliS [Duganella alba]MRX19919.1 flagellar export chaperone FliS [Duganella alba]
MFGSRQTGVNAYAKVGIETGVLAASPHKLIVMLFDGARVALNDALTGIRNGDIAFKGKSLSRAIMIIDSGLRAALDKKAGGEIAESLDALYEYMSNRLLLANVNSDPSIVEEVQRLLTELRDAWNAIADTPAAGGIPQPNLASA